MTLAESLAWVPAFIALAGDALEEVDVIVCPPFTALAAVADILAGTGIQLGGQNIAGTTDLARTGQISAALLADAGCQWVMLGHWEVRRYLGDDDEAVRRKVHLALAAGLRPLLLFGEPRQASSWQTALRQQLQTILAGCDGKQVVSMACLYEPEAAIGVAEPISPEHAAAGAGFIRAWVGERWGRDVSESLRILYGGSVAPERAPDLLAHPDLDGLGASRQGRDPVAFARIVRQIARTKH